MATRSGIEWTETTWNPVTGCSKVSPGCAHCYAERMAKRLQAMGVRKYSLGFDVATHADALDEPYRWRRPRLVFVNSMSDLFHPSVPAAFIRAVFATMNEASRHTFQVLTKRPERVRALESRLCWTPNVWLGVSIESERWLERLGTLTATGARTKFLSLEPLLGPIPGLDLSGIDWVIAGGESGSRGAPDASPMGPVESAICACEGASPFSSSSGEGCSRSARAGRWTAGPGIRCRPSLWERPRRSPTAPPPFALRPAG